MDAAMQQQENRLQGELRRERRTGTEGRASQAVETGGAVKNIGRSLRQEYFLAKRMAQHAKDLVADPIKDALNAPKQATAWVLRYSWYALIPTWGATILILDLMVFLYMVLGEKYICKLGQEWTPPGKSALGGEAMKQGGRSIELGETIIFLFCNFIFWITVTTALIFIIMIVNFITASFWDQVLMIWHAGGWAFRVIYDMFHITVSSVVSTVVNKITP